MSDGIPKSRVSLTYDTKQPEGREKARELPFRLLILGDVGGSKELPFEQRRLRQLNGRNFGEVIKGLKVEIKDVPLDEGAERKVNVLVDGVKSFSPDDVLRLLTGQKAAGSVDKSLQEAWGTDDAKKLWPGDEKLSEVWGVRKKIVGFQSSYQNSKVLRKALKKYSVATDDPTTIAERKSELATLKAAIDAKLEELKTATGASAEASTSEGAGA